MHPCAMSHACRRRHGIFCRVVPLAQWVSGCVPATKAPPDRVLQKCLCAWTVDSCSGTYKPTKTTKNTKKSETWIFGKIPLGPLVGTSCALNSRVLAKSDVVCGISHFSPSLTTIVPAPAVRGLFPGKTVKVEAIWTGPAAGSGSEAHFATSLLNLGKPSKSRKI